MRLSGRKSSSLSRGWTQRQRLVLLSLIGANIAAFVAQLFLETFQPGFIREYFALSYRGIADAYAWQFFTSMFLHDGPWDLLGNTIILYLLGRDLEVVLGQRHFLFLYLAGAIAGELGHLFLMPANSVLFGAAGGVAAVLVAYATILPELDLASMAVFKLPLRLKAKHLAYGAFGLAAILIVVDRSGTVAHSAYLGGCIAGWGYAHLLGFGRPLALQRVARQRRLEIERFERMSAAQFLAEEIDPLLEKISLEGIDSLTRGERRKLEQARDKMMEEPES
jgi:membrane associated rhomboid family serine protease